MSLPRRRLPMNALRAFEVAARHLHLGAAAAELGVTHGAIGHQVRTLESRLGVSLFEREGRGLRLTRQGVRLRSVVSESLDRISGAIDELDADPQVGALAIGCPPALALTWLVPSLGDFTAAYPEVELRVVPARIATELPGELDLAVCYGEPAVRRGRVRLIGFPEFFPVCSPALGATLRRPGELAGQTLVHEDEGTAWARWLIAAGVEDARPARNLHLGEAFLALAGARAGLGVALGDSQMSAEDLDCGALIRPFAASVTAPHPYFLLRRDGAEHDTLLDALEQWIIDRLTPLTTGISVDGGRHPEPRRS